MYMEYDLTLYDKCSTDYFRIEEVRAIVVCFQVMLFFFSFLFVVSNNVCACVCFVFLQESKRKIQETYTKWKTVNDMATANR